MSTSDRTPFSTATPVTGSVPRELPGVEGVTPGFLSPAELARMANEFFNALPEGLQPQVASVASAVMPPNSAVSGNPYAAVPSPTAPAVPGLAASFTELPPAIVATPDKAVVPDVRTAAPATTGVSVPGGGIDPTAGPAFAFLQDSRPLLFQPSDEPAAL